MNISIWSSRLSQHVEEHQEYDFTSITSRSSSHYEVNNCYQVEKYHKKNDHDDYEIQFRLVATLNSSTLSLDSKFFSNANLQNTSNMRDIEVSFFR